MVKIIRLYDRTCTDYTGNGLAVLSPTACTVTEEAGGQYEVSCTVPVTDDLKSRLLERGRVLKVPVPAMTTPALEVIRQSSGSTTAQLAVYAPKATTKSGGKPVNVWAQKGAYTSIEKLWSGDNVILLEPIESSGEGAKWMHICTPSGTEGWGLVSSFEFVSTVRCLLALALMCVESVYRIFLPTSPFVMHDRSISLTPLVPFH